MSEEEQRWKLYRTGPVQNRPCTEQALYYRTGPVLQNRPCTINTTTNPHSSGTNTNMDDSIQDSIPLAKAAMNKYKKKSKKSKRGDEEGERRGKGDGANKGKGSKRGHRRRSSKDKEISGEKTETGCSFVCCL